MSSRLPSLSQEAFATAIAALSAEPLTTPAMAALYLHYQELARWNERLGLIGPGTLHEVLDRHYGEALAALPLIPTAARQGLDIGSGAGFPGFVLAAARPGLMMTLVEARERKWSFLITAARKASLSCRVLNVRVASPLPAGVPEELDLVTVRALKLDTEVLAALARRLAPEGSILLWTGEHHIPLPRELTPRRSLRLPGAHRRRILELRGAGLAAPNRSQKRRAADTETGGESRGDLAEPARQSEARRGSRRPSPRDRGTGQPALRRDVTPPPGPAAAAPGIRRAGAKGPAPAADQEPEST